MLQAVTTNKDTGRKVIIVGLNQTELSELAGPGHYYVVKGEDINAEVDVVILHGETDAHMLELIDNIVSPTTDVQVDKALKN